MSAEATIELELSNLIDQDDFYMRLDSAVEDIETRLKDGARKGSLDWEIEALRNDMALLNPKERPKFRSYCVERYPRTAKLMGWRAA